MLVLMSRKKRIKTQRLIRAVILATWVISSLNHFRVTCVRIRSYLSDVLALVHFYLHQRLGFSRVVVFCWCILEGID